MWFLIYKGLHAKNSWIGNPKIAFYIGFLENIVTFVILLAIMKNDIQKWTTLGIFTINIILLKLVPLYFLRKDKINLLRDTVIFAVVFSFYNAYLFWQNTNILDIYHKTIDSIANHKNATPTFAIYKRFTDIKMSRHR